MRNARLLLALAAALALAACARHQTTYVIDPQTGQPVPVVSQQYAPQYAQQQYAQQQYAQPQYAQAQYPQPQYAQSYAQPQPQYAQAQPAPSGGRGLFNRRSSAPPVYAQQQAQQPYVLQYAPPQQPQYAQPQYAQPQQPQYAQPQYAAPYAAYGAAPYGYAYAPAEQPYTLDSGDRLRIVVFGQEGISNSYIVDAGGNVNLPLIGVVPARGYSTQQLTQVITDKLKQGYVREPHVSVEVESYRPFFILGEVTNPGQYAYVANMTAETAIAIAGGFAPRADKKGIKLTRNIPGQQFTGDVPLSTPLRPGDTIVVKERWF
jgi:polysaccharide export outer membrane protein